MDVVIVDWEKLDSPFILRVTCFSVREIISGNSEMLIDNNNFNESINISGCLGRLVTAQLVRK